MQPKQILIGGNWYPALSGETICVRSPSHGREIGFIAAGGAEDIDKAVRAARRAFEGAWGRMPALERGRLLAKLGHLILDHHEEIAQLEALDTGKPLTQARADVTICARYFEFYGGAADKLHGTTIPFLNAHQVLVLREPHGVVGHIIPWNYPVSMLGRTLGPALAVGNTCVLKPAEEACLAIMRVAELVSEAGLPPGAINVVTGYGDVAGAALSAHPGIDFISFTGSPEVGVLIQTAAAQRHRPCVLELGGKSPQIVFEDARQDLAIEAIVKAIVQNGGQTCSAGSRVLIQRTIYEPFMRSLSQRFSQLVAGPHDADLDCGGLINVKQKQRVEDFIASGVASGLEIVARGRIDNRADPDGYFVAPTLFGPVPEDHDLAREEIFGPVLVAIPFDDEEDAVRIANSTDYGLVVGIWTENGGRQMRLAKQVRSGQVFINTYGAGGGVELPFGGVGKSGHGREKGFDALYEFTAAKTIVLNHG